MCKYKVNSQILLVNDSKDRKGNPSDRFKETYT